MSNLRNILFCMTVVLTIVFSTSCKKEVKESASCIDCSALNYDIVKKNNEKCVYAHQLNFGTYLVNDSTLDWSQTVFRDTFNITIKSNNCDTNGILLENLINVTNSINQTIDVVATVIDDSIYIKQQTILGPDNIATADYIRFSKSVGYFNNDSIYIPYYYVDRHDPYSGAIEGKLITSSQ